MADNPTPASHKEEAETKEGGRSVNGVKRVEIEPGETGGFMTRVVHKEKPSKDGKMNMTFMEPELHVHANVAQLHDFLKGCFPEATSRTKKGKSSSVKSGGSQVDTYEGGQGDEKGY